MAGAGYKLFNTGDVLTAAQVNTYLMEQTVMVFADAAARTTALTGVVSEGMISYLKDTNAVEVYNGSAWVSSDDPNAIQNTIVDAKGDLITATAADTPARLAVGANETRLVADSAQSTGLKYVADTTNYAIAAKGDLLVGTAADTVTALTVGADHSFLKSLASATNGVEWTSGWTSYTPTLNGGVTLGNGTRTGQYIQIGKTVIGHCSFTFGSTSSMGTYFAFTLPVTIDDTNRAANAYCIGRLEDAGTNNYPAGGLLTPDLGVIIYALNATGTYLTNSNITSTVPFTWANGDYISIYFTYKAA